MKILFVCGSLRKASLNLQLAQAAEKLLENKAEVTFLNYHAVPVFDQDLEFPVPDAVRSCRDAFEMADGIWFFTPEYNQQIPSPLKNLLDWMSRPETQGGSMMQTALRGAKTAISGIGGRNMTKGSRALLRQMLEFCGAKVLDDSCGFAMSRDDMTTSHLTVTPEMTEALQKEADAFLKMLEN